MKCATHDHRICDCELRGDQLPEPGVLPACKPGFASEHPPAGSDMITCPGGDFCALAKRPLMMPVAQAITERYQDLDELA
ncbi:MAG: hypothetical protein IPI20_18650 [Rhodoferax sp.]|nr:hypothetical protein [Rhodoferax sp.]